MNDIKTLNLKMMISFVLQIKKKNENNTNELILSAGKKPDTNVYTNIK